MGLYERLSEISTEVPGKLPHIESEGTTITALILPFINALGYDVSNPAEVKLESNADPLASGKDTVDCKILREGEEIILIEAKSANLNLSDKHWKQLYKYYGASEARFGILTNGIEYRFYTDLEKLNIMDKQPFLIIDMLNLDDGLVNELEGFTKASFDVERILSSARKLGVLRLLAKEYAQPSEELVRFFARQLYTGNLSKQVIDEFAPVFKQAWREFVEQKIASRLQTAIESESSPAETEAPITVEESPIQPILEDGMEIPVFAEYRGHRFEATLSYVESNWRESRIRFEGALMTPSRAGKKLILSIRTDVTGENNGWDFWKLRDPYGNGERPISDLRDDEALRRRLLL